MKKITFLVTLFLLLVSVYSLAQDELPFSLGGKVGWFWAQDDDVKEYYEDNWMVGADLTFWFNENIGVGGEVQYLSVEETVNNGGATGDFEMTMVPLNANAYLRMPLDEVDSEAYIYFGGGVSFVMVDYSIVVTNGPTVADADDNVLGYNFKIGFQYGYFFAEGQYIYADWEDEDINVGGFSAWGGIRF